MSISKLLKNSTDILKSAGILSAEIDARILLEFASGKSREFLLAHPEYELSDIEVDDLSKLVARRKLHEPIAYITGHKEFFGLDFLLTPDVLIPRPETELLVEKCLDFLQTSNHKPQTVLDIGSGSGNIIISIATNCNLPTAIFFASDVSKKALIVARKNANNHQVKIEFIQSNLFEKISGKFDLIVANLPYVPIDGSSDREIKHEPQTAIFADNNGEMIIKNFLSEAKNFLADGGQILIEVDPRNAKSLARSATKDFENIEILKDYSGKNRFIRISN